jgi:hypothetical protein
MPRVALFGIRTYTRSRRLQRIPTLQKFVQNRDDKELSHLFATALT